MAKETSALSLYARINAVKGEITRVPKTGKNQHFGYMYATESDISDLLRPIMAKHGVCLLYHGPDHERGLTIEEGEKQNMYRFWVRYELVNVDDPTQREEIWALTEALDGQDKGITKALTAASKYVWLKAFDISTGDQADEPDAQGGTEKHRPAATAPSPKKTLGVAGANKLIARLKEHGMSHTSLEMQIVKLGGGELIAYKSVPDWPVDVVPMLLKIFDKPAVEAHLEQGTIMTDLLTEVDRLWHDKTKNVSKLANDPKTPAQMVKAMMESKSWPGSQDEKAAAILRDLKLNRVIFPSGDQIPF